MIEDIDSMGRLTEHADNSDGADGNQLVKVCTYVWMIKSRAFTSGTMSVHTTQHHYIGIIDQWK